MKKNKYKDDLCMKVRLRTMKTNVCHELIIKIIAENYFGSFRRKQFVRDFVKFFNLIVLFCFGFLLQIQFTIPSRYTKRWTNEFTNDDRDLPDRWSLSKNVQKVGWIDRIELMLRNVDAFSIFSLRNKNKCIDE